MKPTLMRVSFFQKLTQYSLLILFCLSFSSFQEKKSFFAPSVAVDNSHTTTNFSSFYGQSSEHIVVSYKSPFNHYLDTSIRWHLVHSTSGTQIAAGTGSIANYIFPNPGKYQLHLEEVSVDPNHICNHGSGQIDIEVSPYHMVFDFSTIQLSVPIRGEQATKGTTLSVEVDFSSYDQSGVLYQKELITSGIRTTIKGHMQEAIWLQPGKNSLEFNLSGQASANTYISIDFIDINNQIQNFNLTYKL